MKVVDVFIVISTTSTSVTLHLTGLLALPFFTPFACGLTLSDKIRFELVIEIYAKYNKTMREQNKQLISWKKVSQKIYRI